MGESTNADSYHELPLYAAIHTLKPQTFLVIMAWADAKWSGVSCPT
jgi:hypothetical protein